MQRDGLAQIERIMKLGDEDAGGRIAKTCTMTAKPRCFVKKDYACLRSFCCVGAYVAEGSRGTKSSVGRLPG